MNLPALPVSIPCPLDFDPVVEAVRLRAFARGRVIGAHEERARVVAAMREAAKVALCSGCRVQGETLAQMADSLEDVGRSGLRPKAEA